MGVKGLKGSIQGSAVGGAKQAGEAEPARVRGGVPQGGRAGGASVDRSKCESTMSGNLGKVAAGPARPTIK